MTREELLNAFAEMSPEDREAIQRELAGAAGAREAGPACIPGAMKQHMLELMKKMQGSGDPMACCREMMGMCQEMMKKRAEQASP